VQANKRKEEPKRLRQTNINNLQATPQNKKQTAQSFGETKKHQETTIRLDPVDIKILSILQENCKLSYRKLGNMLGLSGVIVASRIKNLEQKGLLKGYTAILDPVKLGYDLTAIIFVQTEGGFLNDIEAELEKTANVIGVYEVTGDFDIIAVAKLRDRESLNILIKNLLLTPHVKRTLTNITLNVVKEDFKLPF
jgi:Lrp/AsnC family transcriptional regulator for asnA, asnC and gidA